MPVHVTFTHLHLVAQSVTVSQPLATAQTAHHAIHHDGDARAERFTLLHGVRGQNE